MTKDPNISINDNITWVHGKHSLDFGFTYVRQTFNELGNQFSRGSFTFQANATAEASAPGKLVKGTGSAFADFLLGQLYTSVYAVQIAQADYKRNVEAAYVDDNYKFSPKLTVSAGLRYELTPPWHDILGNEFIVDLQTNNSPISPFVSGPEPQSLWPFFRRQGNCTTRIRGLTSAGSTPKAPLSIRGRSAPTAISLTRSCRPPTTTSRLASALPTRRPAHGSSARATACITTMTPPTPALTWPVTWPGV